MAMDFLAEYKTKTNDELLRIALEAESLVPEARHALAAVLKDRQLDSPAALAKFREEERQRLHRERTTMSNLVLVVPAGMGRRMYGKKNRVADEYDTTLFIVFLWFPLIPLGTYRIREASPKSFYVLDKKALDWRQVLATRLKAGAAVMAICLVIRLLAYLA
jgi:hypothetical protein